MIIAHEVLEHGDFAQRQQVVRWVRRFPFSFISDRQYSIARRLYRLPGNELVAISKVRRGQPASCVLRACCSQGTPGSHADASVSAMRAGRGPPARAPQLGGGQR